MSLLLWRKMVTMRCFVWTLGLQLWSGSETKIGVFGNFLEFYIRPPVSVLLYLNAVLCIIWTSTIP